MKMRVLHQAIMVAALGAFAATAGAAGDNARSDTDAKPSAMQGSEATSKGTQGTTELNAGSTDRSANKDATKQSADRSWQTSPQDSRGEGGTAPRSGDSPQSPPDKTSMSAHENLRAAMHGKAATKTSKASSQRHMAQNMHESPRHDAVRKCAEEKQRSERESCLDQVVAQYGG